MIGTVISCYTLATLVVRPFSGYMMDTFKRKPLYLLALSIFTAVFFGYLFATTITILIIIRIVHGLAFGLTSVGGNTLVIDVVPSEHRGEGCRSNDGLVCLRAFQFQCYLLRLHGL